MVKSKKNLQIAYDSNTYRCELLIPFLIQHHTDFDIFIPTIIYAEKGYSYLLKGLTFETFNIEINAYHGKIITFSKLDIEKTMIIAMKFRKLLPFKDHSRDYFIAGQCKDKIDIFITYNKKHFQMMELNPLQILTPEEFISKYHP